MRAAKTLVRYNTLMISALLAALVAGGCGADDGESDTDTSAADTLEDTAEPDTLEDTTEPDTLEDTAEPDTLEDTAEPDTAADVDAQGDTGAEDTSPDIDEDVTVPTSIGMSCNDSSTCKLPCGDGQCIQGRCTFDSTTDGCIDVDPATDVGSCLAPLATIDGSSCLFCNPAISTAGFTSVVFEADFEADNPLIIEKIGDNPATWSRSGRRTANGLLSLYFGEAQTGTYGVGGRSAAWATTDALQWPALASDISGGGLVLTFELWLETEQTKAFDFLRILVLPPQGTPANDLADIEIWHSDSIGGTTYGEFLPINITLPDGLVSGSRLRFEFDTIDGIINDFEGAYIDGLRVATLCCNGDSECQDANPCTADSCVDGQCVFADDPECCLSRNECDDQDACTTNLCPEVGGSCSFEPKFDCCHETADCDDNDPCTEDICQGDGAICIHQPLCCENDGDCNDGDACSQGSCNDGQCSYVLACCSEADDCDDGNACTQDSCQDEVCSHDFQVGPGCCLPDVLTERFDSGLPLQWALSPAISNVGWRLQTDAEAPSGTHVLYYGHPTLQYYDNGQANSGTVTTASVHLPEDTEVRLTFQLRLDVEVGAFKDTFMVEADLGSETVVLLTKADVVVGPAWQDVSVDVSYLAGQDLQLRFSFDTVDGLGNATNGVKLDNVRLLSSCQPRPCVSDASCSSVAACVVGSCSSGGGCSYDGSSCGD